MSAPHEWRIEQPLLVELDLHLIRILLNTRLLEGKLLESGHALQEGDADKMLDASGRPDGRFACTRSRPGPWPSRQSGLCADSILSRAVEHARVLDIKGPNMREYTASLKAEADKGY